MTVLVCRVDIIVGERVTEHDLTIVCRPGLLQDDMYPVSQEAAEELSRLIFDEADDDRLFESDLISIDDPRYCRIKGVREMVLQ